MKSLLLLTAIIVLSITSIAQINLEDSTVSVYSYWKLKDKQTYQAIINKYNINIADTANPDTTAKEQMSYMVDIEVIDSTKDSYTINWRCYDFQSNTLVDNISKLMAVTKDMTITYKISDLGVFKEVVNWKEIRELISEGTDILREQADNEVMNKAISDYKQLYGSKENIEAGAIQDIQLYHYFHGAKYNIDQEYNVPQRFVNMFGGEPFDGNTNLWIESVDDTNSFTTFRSYTAIDELQLTNAAFEYATSLSKRLNMPRPSINDMPNIKNESYLFTQIHNSGWIFYTLRRKEVNYNNELKVDELSLELM